MSGLSNRKAWIPAVAFCAGLAALLAGAASYLPFIADDALISFRYAERLAEGKGLTWTDGRPVEGYSNLLWVLLMAGPAALGQDVVAASRVLGVACIAVVLLVLVFHYRELLARSSPFALCALGFSATSGTLVVWSIGGLETALLAALLAIAVSALLRAVGQPEVPPRHCWTASAAFGLLCITRPDAPLLVVVAYATFFLVRTVSGLRLSRLDVIRLAAFPIALTLGQLLFRLVYYGEWVPNTALVKIALTSARIGSGWDYVVEGYSALIPMTVLGFGCLLFQLLRRSHRPKAILLASLLATWTAYLTFIGGDIFPAFRHFAPMTVLGAFLIAETDSEATPLLRGSRANAIGLVACVVVLSWFGAAQRLHPQNQRAEVERWEWDGKVVAVLLKTAFAEQQPLVAVTTAGCIPFWSRLPSIDMLGLNDHYLPRHPPSDFGNGSLAHELGSGEYILRRNPDLIVFHVGSPRLHFRTGDELARSPEFFERYVDVTVVGHDPHRHEATVWMNQTSTLVGVLRSDSHIRVPAYLFARGEGAIAELDQSNQLVLRLEEGRSVSLELADVDAALWKLSRIEATPPSFDASIAPSPGGARITLTATGSTPIEVRGVELVRAGGVSRADAIRAE